MDEHQKKFLKILSDLSYGRSKVLEEWAEMAAISLSNAMMPNDEERRKREDRYLQLAKQYDGEALKGIVAMFGCVANSLTGKETKEFLSGVNLHDCLGEMYMSEEMRSRWDTDVAFTPFHVSYMMAKMTLGPNPIPAKGYLTIGEPAAGTGGLIIAAAQVMKDLKLNYQQCMWIEATEIRLLLAQMCYIQLSLLHIPAVVIHGDSLSQDTWSRWYTPAHVLGFWGVKLRRDRPVAQNPANEPVVNDGKPQFSFNFERGVTHETTTRATHRKASRPAARVRARSAP